MPLRTTESDGNNKAGIMSASQRLLLVTGMIAVILAVFTLMPESLAQEQGSSLDEIETEVGSVHNFGGFVNRVWGFASPIVFAMSVIAIIVGGIMLVASGGNEDRADMGRQTVHGGVIAIIITLMSGVAYKFITAPVSTTEKAGLEGLYDTLVNAANALLTVVAGASAIALVYSGIKYMTSGGDEEKLDSAKTGVKFAIIGLVVGMSGFGILNFLLQTYS